MPSATRAAQSRSSGGNNLLKGSDLPAKQNTLTVKVTDAREAPDNFSSPIILDIEDVLDGKTSVPLNLSNTRALAELLGDDYSQWVGSKVTFTKVMRNNPKTGQQVWGLLVSQARQATPKQRKKAKAARKVAVGKREDDDVPF